MQRRNVLLPEPEGPMMHITSFGATSRLIPRSTSWRPKLLWPAAARLIGCGISDIRLGSWVRPAQGRQVLGIVHERRGGVELEEKLPDTLQRCGRQHADRAAGVVPLDVVLAQGEQIGRAS